MAGRERMLAQISKVIVGQRDVVDQLLISLFSGGHCLITGAPGLAKTLLVRTIAQVFELKFQRIQFTPDLMPADITGTEILQDTSEGRKMTFVRGPVFANIILADEINRTPPKTQAALLEAMQEHQVTAAGVRFPLEEPFFVLATQNPIEMEGTYPLPEAQLDRFLLKLNAKYPDAAELGEIVDRTTAEATAMVRRYVRYGASPRGLIVVVLAAKAMALFAGRINVSFDDIAATAVPALQHRILLNLEGEADGIDVEAVIAEVIRETPRVTGSRSP